MPLHKDIRAGSGVTLALEHEWIDEMEKILATLEGDPTLKSCELGRADIRTMLELLRTKTVIVVRETPDHRAENMARIEFDAPKHLRVIFPENDDTWGNR